jgi:hypothetical protein
VITDKDLRRLLVTREGPTDARLFKRLVEGRPPDWELSKTVELERQFLEVWTVNMLREALDRQFSELEKKFVSSDRAWAEDEDSLQHFKDALRGAAIRAFDESHDPEPLRRYAAAIEKTDPAIVARINLPPKLEQRGYAEKKVVHTRGWVVDPEAKYTDRLETARFYVGLIRKIWKSVFDYKNRTVEPTAPGIAARLCDVKKKDVDEKAKHGYGGS